MIQISPIEARVLGALIEKEVTTPDQYPLSLNGLTTACNQKSNREPVTNYSESEVLDTLEGLKGQNLVAEVVFGSRVPKYKHRFCNTEFSVLKLNSRELGVLCVMMLRGPQTPGELRSRTQRLCEYTDVSEVEACLQGLMEREKGALVRCLPREPGRRESRYMHLLFGSESVELEYTESEGGVVSQAPPPQASPVSNDRVAVLEEELAQLRHDFDKLRAEWEEFKA